LSADAVVTAFARWAADERARDAASQRTRERWLRQQAQEAATLVDILVDLAEARSRAAISVGGGFADVHGRVVGVGNDFVVVEHQGAATLVALHAVEALRPDAGQGDDPIALAAPSGGERRAVIEVNLLAALAALAAHRSPVRLRLAGGGTLSAELRGVGVDVVMLASPTPRRTVYIPLTAILACTPL
jgi:hypothetical protein